MSFDFDMHRIGRTIAQLRRDRNMTQMQLADEMNVSFQAVSNWERGQSMPDISKLPELAELFGVTIDQLLGRSSRLVEKAAEGKLEELPALTVEEVAGAAPLLPPQQMDTLTDQLMKQEHLPDMTALLPFLPMEMVDELLRQQAAQEGSLVRYAPFASEDAVDEIALIRSKAGKSFMELAPFMSEDAIDRLVREREARGESIVQLAPFMYEDTIDEIALARNAADKAFTELLPFISKDTLNQITLDCLRSGKSINQLLPFVDQSTILQLYEAATKQ
ncbi:MAG: helix-turn-helix transcriptional regulator [Clostridia bacterium]|nr:helix-turn-helix transcriptional regulator [Clostridia bacterium]